MRAKTRGAGDTGGAVTQHFHDALRDASDEELREEARRRGMELHSKQFSQAAQQALRELEGIRRRVDELTASLAKPEQQR